jgi:hypothetical protein
MLNQYVVDDGAQVAFPPTTEAAFNMAITTQAIVSVMRVGCTTFVRLSDYSGLPSDN